MSTLNHLHVIENAKGNPKVSHGSFGEAAFYGKDGWTASRESCLSAISKTLSEITS